MEQVRTQWLALPYLLAAQQNPGFSPVYHQRYRQRVRQAEADSSRHCVELKVARAH